MDNTELKKKLDPFEFEFELVFSKSYNSDDKESIFKANDEEGESTENKEKNSHWIVEGYASTSDIDSQDHTITKEAIAQGAESLVKYNTLLFNHDPDQPIGKVLKSEAQGHKLFIKAEIDHSVPLVWQKIKSGTLSKFSVFGRILDAEEAKVEKKSILVIKSMELFETSVVSVPANPEAKTLVWYIEKSLEDVRKHGYPMLRGFVPKQWVEKIVQDKILQLSNNENSVGGKNMEHLEQAIENLKLALEGMSDSEEKEQLSANLRALEAQLEKGEGPIDNLEENNKRHAMEGRKPSVLHPVNKPNVNKTDVGEVTDEVRGDVTKSPLSDALTEAHKALSAALPELDEENKDSARDVLQWIESLGAVLDNTDPSAAQKSLNIEVQIVGAVQKALKENNASMDQKLSEMEKIQKTVANLATSVASLVQATPFRKGMKPAEEDTTREQESTQPSGLDARLKKLQKHLEMDEATFKRMSTVERNRKLLQLEMYGQVLN